MKAIFRKIFMPLLTPLESGNDPIAYKPLQRYALLFISSVFTLLSIAVFVIGSGQAGAGYLFSGIVFGVGGCYGLIIGSLGNDRAVAKIWGSGR